MDFETIGAITLVVLIIGGILGAIGYNVSYALTEGEEEITIKEKWNKFSGEDAKYLVSSEDGQVFQVTDSLIKWRFDSSSLYASIEEGQVCNIITQGWRFGFFSAYKNIIEADCIMLEVENVTNG